MSDRAPRPAPCLPACSPKAPEPRPDALDPSGANTAADTPPGRLSQLARVFRTAAGILDDLARDGQIRLAAGGDQSVMDRAMPAPSPDVPGKLLTVADLAELCQVDKKTVRRWRDEGRLPEPVQIGGVVRWHPVEFDAWLRGGGR